VREQQRRTTLGPSSRVSPLVEAALEGLSATGRSPRSARRLARLMSAYKPPPLREARIVEAAREHYRLNKKLPTCNSPGVLPGFLTETWVGVNSAGQQGFRGLEKGRTLSKILAPLRAELGIRTPLSEAAIVSAARKHHAIFGRLPSHGSTEPVPGMPHCSWNTIELAGFRGVRGLAKGRSLSKILKPLRDELGLPAHGHLPGTRLKPILTESQILYAAKEHFTRCGTLPTHRAREPVLGLPRETWAAIQIAGLLGLRGLAKGRTLSQILAPLREQLGVRSTLSEREVQDSARLHLKRFGELPIASSKTPVPGMPHTSWGAIDAVGKRGGRGLAKGRTLSKILAPLRAELANARERA